MRKLRRRFKRPKRPYDSNQIKEGKELKKQYGLRRKREIWVSQEILRGFRQRARELIAVSNQEQENILLAKLAKLGLLEKGATLDDVLGLKVEDLLERRLTTRVWKTGLSKTSFQARQSIVHGHVSIDGRKVPYPSYLVGIEEEGKIVSTFKIPEAPGERGVVAVPELAEKEESSEPVKEEPPEEIKGKKE